MLMVGTRWVIGNWKMNGDLAGLYAMGGSLSELESLSGVQVVLCVPLVYLMAAGRFDDLMIGSQTCNGKEKGSFTGEVSVSMLKEVGVELCLAGHSERRQWFGETDELVREKLRVILAGGLWGVLCVGESLSERKFGKHLEVVQQQLGVLEGLGGSHAKLIVAYEPIWAIGSVQATPEQAGEMHLGIYQWLTKQWGSAADEIPILYGGSVKGDNAASFFARPHVHGVLVGGASLKAEDFLPIIQAASQPT